MFHRRITRITADDIIVMSDRDLLAAYQRVGQNGANAQALRAEIARRELDVCVVAPT